MKLRTFFFTALYLLSLGIAFTACENEDGPDTYPPDNETLSDHRAYILYEGSMNANNSGIAFYAPAGDADFIGNIYFTQNQASLGDTGLTMVEDNNQLYVVVSGSKYVTKLNQDCVELTRHSFGEEVGDPRYIDVEDGYAYVTHHGNRVSKLDANTLEEVAFFEGGDNLEGIVMCNGRLYVANTYRQEGSNWIYNTEVFVINPQTMQLEETLDVIINPERLYEFDDKVYLLSRGNYADIPNQLQCIDPAQGNEVTKLFEATKVAEGPQGLLYVVNSNTTYDANRNATTVNTFFTYNLRTGARADMLPDVPAELDGANIYLLAFDDETDDLYIGTTDYVTNGTIYRFNSQGTLVDTFDAGGINPNTMLFIDKD